MHAPRAAEVRSTLIYRIEFMFRDKFFQRADTEQQLLRSQSRAS